MPFDWNQLRQFFFGSTARCYISAIVILMVAVATGLFEVLATYVGNLFGKAVVITIDRLLIPGIVILLCITPVLRLGRKLKITNKKKPKP